MRNAMFEASSVIVTIKARELANEIRRISEAQAAIWQQIPWWANQANGRSGFSDSYATIYEFGYSPTYSVEGRYKVYVDLENGKLVCPTLASKECEDCDVLPLAHQMYQLDALTILENLKKKVQEPYSSSYSAVEIGNTEINRTKNIELYGLTPLGYKRNGRPAF